MQRVVFCLLAFCAVSVLSAALEGTGRASLLVHKKLVGERVHLPGAQYQLDPTQREKGVELFANGRNFTVEIGVYNVGDASAHDVMITDSWPDTQFQLITGSKTAKFDEIKAGAVSWMNLTLVPNFDGDFEGFPAAVEYRAKDKDTAVQTALSSPMPDLTILDEALFEKLTAKHSREWTLFGLTVTLSVALPALLFVVNYLGYKDGIPRAPKRS